MNKAYQRTYWEDYPNDTSPIDKKNLNNIETGLEEIDDRVIVLDSTKATKVEVSTLISEVGYDENTGIVTFTRKNGASFTIDTPMEKIQTGIYYNPDTEKLVLPLIDGTSMEVDLSRLMKFDEFIDSDTIAFSVKSNGTVTATVKEGSIEEKHLRPNYLADIKVEVAKAEASKNAAATSESNAKASENAAKASQTAAKTSETNAATSATNAADSKTAAANSASAAKTSETNAASSASSASTSATTATQKANAASTSATNAANSAVSASGSASTASTKATEAANSATQSKSYAVGGTGTRSGEDSDNAKEYARQAKESKEEVEEIISQNVVLQSEKGVSGGVATLDNNGKIPKGQLPSDIGSVTGVKGSAESSYRKGDVNLTAENIGAMPTNSLMMGNIDFNSLNEQGFYEVQGDESHGFLAHAPNDDETGDFYVTVLKRDDYYITQIAVSARSDNTIYIRSKSDNEWLQWKDCSEAVKLRTPRNINGVAFDGTKNITINTLPEWDSNRFIIQPSSINQAGWYRIASGVTKASGAAEIKINSTFTGYDTISYGVLFAWGGKSNKVGLTQISSSKSVYEVTKIRCVKDFNNVVYLDIYYDTATPYNTIVIQLFQQATINQYLKLQQPVLITTTYSDSSSATYGTLQTVLDFSVCDIKTKAIMGDNIYNSSGIITSSDRNLKNNIRTLDKDLAESIIDGINPASFKYNNGESGRTHYGIIAQELEELLVSLDIDPDKFAPLVKQFSYKEENMDGNGEPSSVRVIDEDVDPIYYVRYEEFISLIIKYCQGLKEEITDLKDKMSRIYNKN